MGSILVVCYSRTGTTARLGKELAVQLGADFEVIQEHVNRRGVLGFALSALESVAKGLPAIRTELDPRCYELVVLGTPVWAGSMASPVRSYLFAHRAELPRTAFFAVMGGHGADETLRELKFVCRAEEAPTCSFTEADVHGMHYARKFQDFVAALKGYDQRLSGPLSPAADSSTWPGDIEPAGRFT